MKKTLKEKILFRLLGIAKRNIILKYPMLVCIFFVCWISSVYKYFCSNCKRFTSISVVFLFFALCNSFSFPVFEDNGEEFQMPQYLAQQATEEVGTIGTKTDDGVEILEDADVIDGYEDTNICQLDNVTKYTLEDILEENQEVETEKDVVEEQGVNNFSKEDWRYVLINKQHPIPEDFILNLGTIKGSMKCDARIIDELLKMLQAAKRDGVNLVICSPYRDLSRQQMLFERKIDAYMKKGLSYMEAYKTAAQAVTVPGASEHQIGLAIDIVSDTYASLNTGFADTDAGKWLAEHSCEYGFILRYPLGKEYITSIEFEPWHFRYVGKEAATVITSEGITLEEFVENL